MQSPAAVGGDGRQGDTGSHNLHPNLRVTMGSLPQPTLCTGALIIILTAVVVVVVLVLETVRVTAATHSRAFKSVSFLCNG